MVCVSNFFVTKSPFSTFRYDMVVPGLLADALDCCSSFVFVCVTIIYKKKLAVAWIDESVKDCTS